MRYLWIILPFFVAACGPKTDPKPPPDPEPTVCTDVCAHYEQLGCPEAEPTPEGHTCVEVCENLKDSPIPDVDQYFTCVTHSTSCEAAKACE